MFPREYEEGSIIIKQGDNGDNFYVLDTGVCEVYKDDQLVQTVRTKNGKCDYNLMKIIFSVQKLCRLASLP